MNNMDKTKIINEYNKYIMSMDDNDDITHKVKNKLMVDFADKVVEKAFPSKKSFVQRLMGE